MQDNQTRVEVGTMAPIDVVQAQSSRRPRSGRTLVDAEGTRRTTELALKRLIVAGTEDPNWDADARPGRSAGFRPEPIDIAAAVRRALERAHRPRSIAQEEPAVNDITLKYLHNQTLPQADLQARYGLSAMGGTQFIRLTRVRASAVRAPARFPAAIADALSSLFGRNYPTLELCS